MTAARCCWWCCRQAMRSSALHVRRQTNLPFSLRFLDQQGADFLVELFALSSDAVRRTLICRPLNEPESETLSVVAHLISDDWAFTATSTHFLHVPPSGREAFHAKVVLGRHGPFTSARATSGSALDRSFECGVIVHGETARQLRYVIAALQSIARLSLFYKLEPRVRDLEKLCLQTSRFIFT